jgi:hypothetical protein
MQAILPSAGSCFPFHRQAFCEEAPPGVGARLPCARTHPAATGLFLHGQSGHLELRQVGYNLLVIVCRHGLQGSSAAGPASTVAASVAECGGRGRKQGTRLRGLPRRSRDPPPVFDSLSPSTSPNRTFALLRCVQMLTTTIVDGCRRYDNHTQRPTPVMGHA